MNLQLTDKVFIVTGGTSGIGLATSEILTQEGAKVVVLARGTHDTELPYGVDFIQTDITHTKSAEYAVHNTLKLHGRIDGIVNNAAVLVSQPSFSDINDSQWHEVFNLNLYAGIRLIRIVLPILSSNAEGGSIVHVGSEAGRMPDPTIADYAATKAALLSLSKSLSIEYGPLGVRSNVVSPGPTRTALFDAPGGFAEQLAKRFGLDTEAAIEHFIQKERRLPIGHIGRPENVADLIAYLLSPRAQQVTGAEWSVDGGALRQI